MAPRDGVPGEECRHEVRFTRSTARPARLLTPPHPAYAFTGPSLLTDGLRGNKNYRTGRWLGFYDADPVAVVDLGTVQPVAQVAGRVCVNKDDGCFDTRRFEVAASEDGTAFRTVAAERYDAMTEADDHGVYVHTLTFDPAEARYVRVALQCEHTIPQWHPAHGAPAFLFLDEIEIE